MTFWNKLFGTSKRVQGSAIGSVPSHIMTDGATLTPPPGYDCPFYSEGFCRVGGGDSRCSLGSGRYWTDCHVYPTTGLKGKYDKEQVEAASRRALLKKCSRCGIALQIPQHLDFKFAIREFASESQFRLASEASGISCTSCHADFCTKCMVMYGKRHPRSGGLACLSCGGHMAEFNP